MSEWYFRHKATMACFFLIFAVFCFALAAKAGAAAPKLTYAQKYAAALCIGIKHAEPPSERKSVWIQKCTPGPIYGVYPGQMYYVYVVATKGNTQHYLQVVVDSAANISSEKLIWSHNIGAKAPKV